jgi:hypothetical protein
VEVRQEVLSQLLNAMHCVKERKYRGGTAPERVQEHISAARENVARDRQAVMSRAASIEAARHRLDSAFAALQRTHS